MSFSLGALFLRIDDPVTGPQKIRAEYDDIEVTVDPATPFVCVRTGRADYKPLHLPGVARLSRSFGELIDLQASDYSLRYEHWQAGEPLRRLSWTEDAAWEVEGRPEDWEATFWPAGAPQHGDLEPSITPAAAVRAITEHFRLPVRG